MGSGASTGTGASLGTGGTGGQGARGRAAPAGRGARGRAAPAGPAGPWEREAPEEAPRPAPRRRPWPRWTIPATTTGLPSLVPVLGAPPTALVFVQDGGRRGALERRLRRLGGVASPHLTAANVTPLNSGWGSVNGQTMTTSLLATSTSRRRWGGRPRRRLRQRRRSALHRHPVADLRADARRIPGLPGSPVMLEVTGDQLAGLAATSSATTGGYALSLAISKVGTGWAAFNAGCATTPPAADAAPTADGWILAAALGTPLDLSTPENSIDRVPQGSVSRPPPSSSRPSTSTASPAGGRERRRRLARHRPPYGPAQHGGLALRPARDSNASSGKFSRRSIVL